MHQLHVQVGAGAIEQLQFLKGQGQQVRFDQLGEFGGIPGQGALHALLAALGPGEEDHLLAAPIDHTTETIATADRPIHGPAG